MKHSKIPQDAEFPSMSHLLAADFSGILRAPQTHIDNVKMLEIFPILWEVFRINLLTQGLPSSDLLLFHSKIIIIFKKDEFITG